MTVSAASATLTKCRVLVAEDEYMIAEEVASVLGDAGAEVLGPVARVADALRVAATEGRIDCALLDVNLRGEVIWPVVDALLSRGVPVALATGYHAGAIPGAYAHLPRCEKPASGHDLTRALARALVPHSPAGAEVARPA
jgi:CheY-like chemotaxis protein